MKEDRSLPPFFCQLDNERHPASEDRYQCRSCGRVICPQCFEAQKVVGLSNCPFCEGEFEFLTRMIITQQNQSSSARSLEVEKELDVNAFLIEITDLEQNSLYQEALEKVNEVLLIHPHNMVLLNTKGKLLESLGRHLEALTCFTQVLDVDPKNEEAWYNKGYSLGSIQRHKQAIDCFNETLAINPMNSKAWSNKGASLGALKQYDEALECYEKAIATNPRDEVAWFNRGIILELLGYRKEAIHCYERVLELNPSDQESLQKIQQLR